MHNAQLNEQEFNQFRSWLYEATGINIGPAKKALVEGRLFKRVQHYQLRSYGDYFRLIQDRANTLEKQMAVDLLTTNETYFFREPKHFDFLARSILPQAVPQRQFRVWSAACSSGEEPYSLAMILADHLPALNWEILCSDISTRMLDSARSAHYPLARAHSIPQHLLRKYCLKGIGAQDGTFLVDPELRRHMEFCQINLNAELPNTGSFDVIFLRNVMIYFDVDTKRNVVERLLPKLKTGGHFIVSHSESITGHTNVLKMISPSMYRKL